MLEAMMKKSLFPEEPSSEARGDIQKIETMLNKSGFRLRFQKMDNLNPELLLKQLENTYNVVVDKYLVCRNNPKHENIHVFRKKSKDFLYQLWFFRPLNPSVIKALEKKLDAMTQNLGKFNDLAQLILKLEYKYSGTAEQAAMDELVILIREAQDRYLSRVWPVAYKIFCPGKKLINVLGFRLLTI
jgi:CHAD domain-containing protein